MGGEHTSRTKVLNRAWLWVASGSTCFLHYFQFPASGRNIYEPLPFVLLNETQADPGSWWIQEALLWSCISPSGAHPIFHLTGCSRAVTLLASPHLAEVRYMLQFFCPSGRLAPALDALQGSGERGCTLQLHKRSGQVCKKHIRVASFCDLQWLWREPPSSAEHKGWRLRWKNAKIITERSPELSN